MRQKLYKTNDLPEDMRPQTTGTVHDAATPEGVAFLKNRLHSRQESTAQRDVRELREAADPSKARLKQIAGYVQEQQRPIAPFEIADHFEMHPMKMKETLLRLAGQKNPKVKRLISGKFCSMVLWESWDQDQQWTKTNE